MNINSSINRILTALANKGKYYKYNTFKFYSEDNCKYSTKHQLLEKHEKLNKYNVVKESYSNRDILIYLMEEYKGMG